MDANTTLELSVAVEPVLMLITIGLTAVGRMPSDTGHADYARSAAARRLQEWRLTRESTRLARRLKC